MTNSCLTCRAFGKGRLIKGDIKQTGTHCIQHSPISEISSGPCELPRIPRMRRLTRRPFVASVDTRIVHAVEPGVGTAFPSDDVDVRGRSCEHRRLWIRQSLVFLASVFGIDCLTQTARHNHPHLVLCSRADVVQSWSDDEIARRWLRPFSGRRNKDGSPASLIHSKIVMIVHHKEQLAEQRWRLSDVSWWAVVHLRKDCSQIESRRPVHWFTFKKGDSNAEFCRLSALT